MTRLSTHCTKGHEYTPENSYYYTAKSGSKLRRCARCDKIKRDKYRSSLKYREYLNKRKVK